MESTSALIVRNSEEDGIEYPESDGKPMAETDEHRDLMIQFIEGLKDFYRNDSNVYVALAICLFILRKGILAVLLRQTVLWSLISSSDNLIKRKS